jgi:fumarate hydratase class I
MKTVKLASTKWLDELPTVGSRAGHAIRDLEMEQKVLEMSQSIGIGAQFGGKYFCHDVRVIRLARHGASLPVGIGVSCSADRQIKAKITPEGVFLEQLETDPSKYLPEATDDILGGEVVAVDLNRPMTEIRRELSRYPVKTRLALNGTMVVARDIAHAKLKERLDAGGGLPGFIMPVPPRRRTAMPPAASAPPRPGAWTATSPSSRRPAARSSCSPRATARRR